MASMIRSAIFAPAVSALIGLGAVANACAANKPASPPPQMDGAILVVSAADGPMPAHPGCNPGLLAGGGAGQILGTPVLSGPTLHRPRRR